jgi:hypothetical protein
MSHSELLVGLKTPTDITATVTELRVTIHPMNTPAQGKP